METVEDFFRYGVGEVSQFLKNAGQLPAKKLGSQPGGLRIDRYEAAGMRGIARRALKGRVLHNESFSVATDFPADADLHLRFQGLRDETLVEPDETDLSARISERYLGEKHFLL